MELNTGAVGVGTPTLAYAGIPGGEEMLPPDVVWPCGWDVLFDLNEESRFWADDFRRMPGLSLSGGCALDIDMDIDDWLKLDILGVWRVAG